MMPRFALAFACLWSASGAWGHESNTSFLRVNILPDAIETRVWFDVFALTRLVPNLDANVDHAVSRAELEAAAPALAERLRRVLFVDPDGQQGDLGSFGPIHWPTAEPSGPILERDYTEKLIWMSFLKTVRERPREVMVTCDVYSVLGTRHRVNADIGAPGFSEPVVLTIFEPDYLYDVGYAMGQMGAVRPTTGSEEGQFARTLTIGTALLGAGLLLRLTFFLRKQRSFGK